MENENEDEEVFIGDEVEEVYDNIESSQEIVEEIELSPLKVKQFQEQINLCSMYFPYLNIKTDDRKVDFQIPSKILPLSTQMVCGFTVDPVLLNISFTINKKYEWNEPTECLSCSHPVYNQSYYGRPLVLDEIRLFFSKQYNPKSDYRSCAYAFNPLGESDPQLLQNLISEGFDSLLAHRALVLNQNDIEKSRNFLLTGQLPTNTIYVPISFDESPLVFLALEIIECFIELSDHCCICRANLPFSGIRPNICNKPLCNVSFNEIGVGTSVLQEIKRDSLAADFIISIFSFSFANRRYMNPPPPQDIEKDIEQIVSNLPSMNEIISSCINDTDISKLYGAKNLSFLRWILLSNRSQVISLTGEQRIKEIPTNYQFMTLIASPEVEYEFLLKKNKYGSKYMWHGSGGERWHSILRNGLKNMSNVPGEAIHGTAFGSGIYFAKDSNMSCTYSLTALARNYYKNSVIGPNFNVLALCEVATVSSLKDHGQCYTLADEKACIVRLMVPFLYPFSMMNSIQKIPTLDEIIKMQATKVNENKKLTQSRKRKTTHLTSSFFNQQNIQAGFNGFNNL